MIAESFAKQTELEAKTARYNEVMAILNPKEEQVIGEDDGVQEQSRKYLEDEENKRYNKRRTYSETETLFMQWANGSSSTGEIKAFYRFGKLHFYEKSENGCVELSRAQYNERNNFDAKNTYTRAQQQAGNAAHKDGSSRGNGFGYSNSNRDPGGAEIVSRQALGEELRNDAERSVSSGRRNSRGTANGVNNDETQ